MRFVFAPARTMALPAALALVLLAASSANAAISRWTGEAAQGSGWSAAKNWQGEVAPSAPGPVSLAFPRLIGCIGACYESKNDLSGLSVESLTIDDGDDYKLSGDEISLGAGGLEASPEAGAAGAAGDVFGLPIELGATQTWNVEQRDGEPTGENGVALYGDLTGPAYGLNIDLRDGPVVYFDDKLEAARLVVENTISGEMNGLVDLQGAELNADGAPVELSHTFLVGAGVLGALKTDGVGVGVGVPEDPALGIEMSSATFDSSSELEFLIAGTGSEPWRDYSQLFSEGAVSLGGSKLYVYVYPPNESGSCPVPSVGQTYTFVETTGTLTGTFGNAPEEGEIPILPAHACGSPVPWYKRDLRIAYHESGATQTVTATVTGGPLAQPTGEATSTAPGAIEQLPVNKKIEEEFEADPRWAKTSTAPSTPAPTGRVELLTGAMLTLRRGHAPSARLDCAANVACAGRLVLTVTATRGARAGRKRMRAVTIGTASFSIAAGETKVVKIALNAAGRRLLRGGHGRLGARVTIVGAMPSGVVK